MRALSNCEEVELFLNGQSQGHKTMKTNSHLGWDVKYAPGTLQPKAIVAAKSLRETRFETTGAPPPLQAPPDRATLKADGEDISIITVALADAWVASRRRRRSWWQFDLEGPGRILGVGSGDPSSHEPDSFSGPAAQQFQADRRLEMEKFPTCGKRTCRKRP